MDLIYRELRIRKHKLIEVIYEEEDSLAVCFVQNREIHQLDWGLLVLTCTESDTIDIFGQRL